MTRIWELISATLTDWCENNDIELVYIEPGKPQQNGFVERFNGTLPGAPSRFLLVRKSQLGKRNGLALATGL